MRILSALALATLVAAPAAAQTALQASDLSPRASVLSPWFDMRSVTLKDSLGNEVKYSQMSVPVGFNVKLGSALSAVLYGAFADTKVTPTGGTETSLSGLTDVRARAFLKASENVVISAGVSAPTGKHQLTAEEDAVAGAAAVDVLGFRVRRYGEGLDVEGGISAAFEAGETGALALGASYLYKGSYEPTVGSTASYRPGSELSGSAGYDYRTPGTLLRLNVAARMFTKDRADTVDVFKQGVQVTLEQRWVATLSDRVSNDLSAHQVLKGSNEYYSGSGTAATTSTAENGSNVGFGERLELDTASGLILAALADADFYGKRDGGYDKAHVLEFGGEVGYAPSPNLTFRVQAKALTGGADPGGITLSGTDIAASVRAAF